jgi:hypothetical protein
MVARLGWQGEGTMTQSNQLHCACGQVRLEVDRAPIVATECYCNSCRAAGTRLERLPAAQPILGKDGGTRFVLYRKDRIRFVAGTDRLRQFRLNPHAKTRRVVATCCNTPIFLEFHNGHWLSLYGGLWQDAALPPIELRTMTSDLPDAAVLPHDIANGKRQSLSFFAKLLGAWIAMGFRSPKITCVEGEIHA